MTWTSKRYLIGVFMKRDGPALAHNTLEEMRVLAGSNAWLKVSILPM